MAQRLLILSCSQCKNPAPDVMPALERYDGPAFRVVRKFFRHDPNQIANLDIYVLSAEFGLIPSSHAIPHYDRRLTPQRADELREQIQTTTQQLTQAAYTTCFIHAGKSYLKALISFQRLAHSTTSITIAAGSPGCRLTVLRDWLYQDKPDSAAIHPRTVISQTVRLRSIGLTMGADQVLAIARQRLAQNSCGSENCHSWYVLVDNKRVAPKWLVSQLTGLPARAFGSGEARRVLSQLGVEILPCMPGQDAATSV